MSDLHLRNLTLHFRWATPHRWNEGQRLEAPAECHSIWFVREGWVDVELGGKFYRAGAGQAGLWGASKRRVLDTPEGAVFNSVGFDAFVCGDYRLFDGVPLPVIWTPKTGDFEMGWGWTEQIIGRTSAAGALPRVDARDVPDFQRRFPSLGQGGQEVASLLCDGLTRALVAFAWEAVRSSAAEPMSGPGWLTEVMVTIRGNPAVEVAELARIAGFSEAQFRRRFEKAMESTPRDWLRRYRLELAQGLLTNTDTPVAEIAVRSGFRDPSHFGEVWKREMGVTPSEFRKGGR